MSISSNAGLHEMVKIVTAYPPGAGGSGEDAVSLKNYARAAVLIVVDNGTTVTGSAITLKQSTDVSLTGEKALAFSTVWANTDTGASDTLVETAVTSNTFTTDTTNAKNLMYVIEVEAADLDVANNFDVLRVDTTAATAAVLSIVYLLYPAKYADSIGGPTAITD